MKKVSLIFLAMFSLLLLVSCSPKKSQAELLIGDWIKESEPVIKMGDFDKSEGNLLKVASDSSLLDLSLTFSDKQLTYFIKGQKKENKINYQFDEKKHELTYFMGKSQLKRNISFGKGGNILYYKKGKFSTETYYRKNSPEAKAKEQENAQKGKELQEKIDKINSAWQTKQNSFLKKFEKALVGTWSNTASNAKVDLKRNSPAPAAKIEIGLGNSGAFEVTFSHEEVKTGQIKKFEKESATNLRISYSASQLNTLFDLTALKNDTDLKKLEKKINEQTLRDLFMEFGSLAIAYELPKAKQQQMIDVSAYQAVVNQNKTEFEVIELKSKSAKEKVGNRFFLEPEKSE